MLLTFYSFPFIYLSLRLGVHKGMKLSNIVLMTTFLYDNSIPFHSLMNSQTNPNGNHLTNTNEGLNRINLKFKILN